MVSSHKPFYFMRHGETEWNHKNLPMGQQDISLNEEGLAQALAASQLIKDEQIKSIFVSPLKRAIQTAEIVCSQTSILYNVVEEIKEASFGVEEGNPNTAWAQEWMAGKPIEGAESFSSFIERVNKGLNIVFKSKHPTLMISHMGVYKIIQKILGMPPCGLQNGEVAYHVPPSDLTPQWTIYKILNTGKVLC